MGSLHYLSGIILDPAVLQTFWCPNEEPNWYVPDPNNAGIRLAPLDGHGFCLTQQVDVSGSQYICQKDCKAWDLMLT